MLPKTRITSSCLLIILLQTEHLMPNNLCDEDQTNLNFIMMLTATYPGILTLNCNCRIAWKTNQNSLLIAVLIRLMSHSRNTRTQTHVRATSLREFPTLAWMHLSPHTAPPTRWHRIIVRLCSASMLRIKTAGDWRRRWLMFQLQSSFPAHTYDECHLMRIVVCRPRGCYAE